MNLKSSIASALVLFTAMACGGMDVLQPKTDAPSASKGAPGGGGGGGGAPPSAPPQTPAPAPQGGTQLPPPSQVDGPAWFFSEIGGVAGPFTANINFDAIQNQTAGGISIGTSRTAAELVYNVSKKTALTITNIAFVGANPADFSIPASELATAATTVLPANKTAIEELHVIFSPTAEGPRSATLQVTSAAGIAQIFLTGTSLPNRPILAPFGPLSFITASAPDNVIIQNSGGVTLSLTSFGIGGANPQAFSFFVANHGLSNCFAGILLAPKASCFLEVGVAAGAKAPASATLTFVTNDPVHPTLNVPLTLAP